MRVFSLPFPSHLAPGEAVFARCLSALKDERALAAQRLPGPNVKASDVIDDKTRFIHYIGQVRTSPVIA